MDGRQKVQAFIARSIANTMAVIPPSQWHNFRFYDPRGASNRVHGLRPAAKADEFQIAGTAKSMFSDIDGPVDDAWAKAVSAMLPAAVVEKGGPGSGNFGHAGRRGKVGGSAPRKEHVAGVTSYHVEKPRDVKQIDKDGRKLADDLKAIKSISEVRYNGVGEGGWEGGSEPTILLSYKGNGEGAKKIAEFAREFGQDGALLRKATTENAPNAQPDILITFDQPLDDTMRAAIEQVMVESVKKQYDGEANVGWTWGREEDDRVSLDSQAVKQWGGDAEKHVAAFADLENALVAKAIPHSIETRYYEVGIMDSDSYDTDHGYTKIIAGADPFN